MADSPESLAQARHDAKLRVLAGKTKGSWFPSAAKQAAETQGARDAAKIERHIETQKAVQKAKNKHK